MYASDRIRNAKPSSILEHATPLLALHMPPQLSHTGAEARQGPIRRPHRRATRPVRETARSWGLRSPHRCEIRGLDQASLMLITTATQQPALGPGVPNPHLALLRNHLGHWRLTTGTRLGGAWAAYVRLRGERAGMTVGERCDRQRVHTLTVAKTEAPWHWGTNRG